MIPVGKIISATVPDSRFPEGQGVKEMFDATTGIGARVFLFYEGGEMLEVSPFVAHDGEVLLQWRIGDWVEHDGKIVVTG